MSASRSTQDHYNATGRSTGRVTALSGTLVTTECEVGISDTTEAVFQFRLGRSEPVSVARLEEQDLHSVNDDQPDGD